MSAAWLYGLMRAPGLAAVLDAAPIEGIGGALQVTDLSTEDGILQLAWCPCDGQPVPQRRRFLKGHAQVLERLMAHGPLLPFRFGHITRDMDRIARLVTEAAADITAQFAHLDGHAEVGLRVSFDREAALEASLRADPELMRLRDRLMARGGGSRMEQIELGRRVAETVDLRRTAAQRALIRALGPMTRDHVLQAPESDVQVLRAAFLVPDHEVAGFGAVVEEAAQTCGFADSPPLVRMVHPTPPFNFVSLSLGADPDSEVA